MRSAISTLGTTRHTLLAFVLIIVSAILPATCFSQDVLAVHKTRGLKGISSLAVVVRPNTPVEIASIREWVDMIELGLHRHVRDLRLLDNPNDAPAWLELSVITIDRGGSLELSVYRWVNVIGTGEDIVAKVWWDSRILVGNLSKKSYQEILEVLLNGFAADYLRAKR